MDLPNTYPTVPELSIANKDFRLVLGYPKKINIIGKLLIVSSQQPRYSLNHSQDFSVGIFGSFCSVWVIECGRLVLVVLVGGRNW